VSSHQLAQVCDVFPQLAQTDSWRRYAGQVKSVGVSVPTNTVTIKTPNPYTLKAFTWHRYASAQKAMLYITGKR